MNSKHGADVAVPQRYLGSLRELRARLKGSEVNWALTGGALGSAIGVRTTLFIGACGEILSVLWLVLSPIRLLRDVADLPSGADA